VLNKRKEFPNSCCYAQQYILETSSFVFKNGQWAPLPFLEFNLLGIGSKGVVAIENGKQFQNSIN
jgi:hypothetical protein